METSSAAGRPQVSPFILSPVPPPFSSQPHENKQVTSKMTRFDHRNKGLTHFSLFPILQNKGLTVRWTPRIAGLPGRKPLVSVRGCALNPHHRRVPGGLRAPNHVRRHHDHQRRAALLQVVAGRVVQTGNLA